MGLAISLESVVWAGDQLCVVEDTRAGSFKHAGDDHEAQLIGHRRYGLREFAVERLRELERDVSAGGVAAKRELGKADKPCTGLGGPFCEGSMLSQILFEITEKAPDLRGGYTNVFHTELRLAGSKPLDIRFGNVIGTHRFCPSQLSTAG